MPPEWGKLLPLLCSPVFLLANPFPLLIVDSCGGRSSPWTSSSFVQPECVCYVCVRKWKELLEQDMLQSFILHTKRNMWPNCCGRRMFPHVACNMFLLTKEITRAKTCGPTCFQLRRKVFSRAWCEVWPTVAAAPFPSPFGDTLDHPVCSESLAHTRDHCCSTSV